MSQRYLVVTSLCILLAGCEGLDVGLQNEEVSLLPGEIELEPVSTLQEREANKGLAAIGWTYAEGLGAGVKVAVVDTGADRSHEELDGQLSDLSRNVVSKSNDITDEVGHGTSIAAIIGAPQNNLGLIGVAPNAELVMIKANDGLNSFTQQALYDAIEYASFLQLPIVNVSLASQSALQSGVYNSFQRGMGDGTLYLVASGNYSGDNVAQPASMADVKDTGALLAVGSVGDAKTISSFANKAGLKKEYYLVAPGEEILTAYSDAGLREVDGTSAATAFVSGVAAILKSRDPHLNGAELAQIILATTEDLGEEGVDDIYGHGLVRLDQALEPIGDLTVPTGSDVDDGGSVVAESSSATSGTFSTASFGDLLEQVLVLDDFGRTFYISMTMADRTPVASSAASSGTSTGTSDAIAFDSKFLNDGSRLRLETDEDVGLELKARTKIMAGLSAGFQSGDLSEIGRSETIQSGAGQGNAILALGGSGVAANLELEPKDNLRLKAMVFDTAASLTEAADGPVKMEGGSFLVLGQSKGLNWGVDVSVAREDESLLGNSWSGAFGETKDTLSLISHASLDYAVNSKIRLGWEATLGHTEGVSSQGIISQVSDLKSSATAMSMTLDDLSSLSGKTRDTLKLTVEQPLRVYQGSANLSVPTSRTTDGQIITSDHSVSLAPQGRQVDLKAEYALTNAEAKSQLQLESGLSLDAGHIEGETDYKFGLSFKRKF